MLKSQPVWGQLWSAPLQCLCSSEEADSRSRFSEHRVQCLAWGRGADGWSTFCLLPQVGREETPLLNPYIKACFIKENSNTCLTDSGKTRLTGGCGAAPGSRCNLPLSVSALSTLFLPFQTSLLFSSCPPLQPPAELWTATVATMGQCWAMEWEEGE